MYRIVFVILVLTATVFSSNAQNKPIHQEQSEYYASFGDKDAAFWDSLSGFKKTNFQQEKSCTLNKIVFGWNPYWAGTAYQNYQWDLLSDLCHFSYEVIAATGQPNSTHSFLTDPAVTAALSNGTRVHLCVTMFGSHATFFANNTAKQTLISNLISLIDQRNAHGINIDFEGVPSAQRDSLTSFLVNLSNQMHSSVPNSILSVCLPAVDWGPSWDIAALNNYVDLFLIMGYDYYWSTSGNAGPTSPTYSFTSGYTRNISRSMTYYLNLGASPSKLALGLPYYGFDYPTSTSTPNDATTGSGSSRTYKTIRANSSGYYAQSNKQWSSTSWVPYWIYNDGTSWRQCYIDDEFSFSKKLDLVQQRGIAGIGIWCLGNDDGYNELWSTINDKLTDCYSFACGDSIFDMGGPAWNYFDNERYTYTIAPPGVSTVGLNFSSFNLETNYDSLWLYDGANINAPLLGVYTGINSPGSIYATGNKLTLRFKSDGGTSTAGFKANVQCITDNVPPTSTIDAGNWETTNFDVSFTDDDNSGVGKTYYQVLDNNGSEWTANGSHGFFNDNFQMTMNPIWTSVLGTWNVSGGHMNQTAEAVINSNIYASVDQTAIFDYVYHWQMQANGAGTSHRAGFHFFCDRPDSLNRYNSYFIWFRYSASPTIEIYKVVNNIFSIVKSVSYPLVSNTWYDVKTAFSPTTGLVEVYVNDAFITSWTDASPYQSGVAISLRTGNALAAYDDVKVYRSRASTETVTIGNSSAMVRYQNASPATPSCRIKSLVFDIYHNSVISGVDVNIDWTPPSDVTVWDGTGTDIDTSYSLTDLDANWELSTDVNSGIAQYLYSVGTTPGMDDVVTWTSLSSNTVHDSGLSLTDGQIYYYNVRIENGAGLFSADSSSNGQIAWFPVGINISGLNSYLNIFPNPVTHKLNISGEIEIFKVTVTDSQGKIVLIIDTDGQKKVSQNIENLPDGIYFVSVNGSKKSKLIIKHKSE